MSPNDEINVGGSGTVTKITSTDGSVVITPPSGRGALDLSATGSGGLFVLKASDASRNTKEAGTNVLAALTSGTDNTAAGYHALQCDKRSGQYRSRKAHVFGVDPTTGDVWHRWFDGTTLQPWENWGQPA